MKSFFGHAAGAAFTGAAFNSFLALLWRERTEVRVVRGEFALTLALSSDGRGKSSVADLFRAQVI